MMACAHAAAQQCENYIQMQERILGIPSHLLRAIALMESGRRDASSNQHTPWPWTIHVNGKGYYLNSKRAAIEAVRKFRKQGFKNIDVGCMQINLYHHPHAFQSLEEAFDPQLNIAYAAKYLKKLRNQYGNWKKAVEHYHSATPIYGHPYRQRVLTSWKKLLKNPRDFNAIHSFETPNVRDTGARQKVEPRLEPPPVPSVNDSNNSDPGMVRFTDFNQEDFRGEQHPSSYDDDGHLPLHKMPKHSSIQVKTKYITLTQSSGPAYIPLR